MVSNEGISQWDEAFAHAVRGAREASGKSQAWLASEMASRGFEFHQATVYKVETGKRRVSIGEAKAIAQVLGFGSLDHFLAGESNSFSVINGRLRSASDAFIRSIVTTDQAALDTLRAQQAMLDAIADFDTKGFTITMAGGKRYSAREHYAAAAEFKLHQDFVVKLRTKDWPVLQKMPWLTKGQVLLDGEENPHHISRIALDAADYGFDRIDAEKLDAESWRLNHEMTDEAIERAFGRLSADA